MNHLDNGTTPFDNENELIECPECLGMKEIFEPFDQEEPTDGKMIECPICAGVGEIPRQDGFTKEQDYLDNEADASRDDD